MTEEITTDVTDEDTKTTEDVKPATTKRQSKEVKVETSQEHETDPYVIKLRREAEKLRKRNELLEEQQEQLAEQKAQSREKEIEERHMKNAQTLLDKRIAELEENSRARLVKSELRAHAMKANVHDFDDLYSIMRSAVKPEFDADGEMTNAGALVAEMKEKKPHLFGGVTTTSTERAPAQRASVASKTEKTALKMSPEEYQKAKRAVLRT